MQWVDSTWYTEIGIVHMKVGLYTSQIDLVERKQKTLLGSIRAMMHQPGVPRSFSRTQNLVHLAVL